MILLIGGAGQGKLDYALRKLGAGPSAVARTPEEAVDRPVFDGLASWVRTHMGGDLEPALEELLEKNPGVVILCDEVGCGVVPVDPEERAWREAVGRLCLSLAEKAERVERLFCGLPMALKGEGAWN